MATIDINRTGVEENQRIEIRLTFSTGKSITASMTVEQFALAITGMSNNPCEIRTRNTEIVLLSRKLKEQPHD